jgi:hypothetical protein
MSEALLTTTLGFGIEDETTGDFSYQRFMVDGIPGDPTLSPLQLLLSDNAPKGSQATDRVTGFGYTKKSNSVGIPSWVKTATLDDIAAATSSDSWLAPAKIKDDTVYADTAALHAALNTGSMDGVTLADGDRVLITGLVGKSKSVYVVSGTPGSGATLGSDNNVETHNDVLIVNEGTSAGKEFHYNATLGQWIDSGQNGLDEDGYQNSYSGKTAPGSELPQYISTAIISNDDNQTLAIGKMDAAVALNVTGLAANTTLLATTGSELDTVENALGAAVDTAGAYVPHTGTNYLDGNGDFTEDFLDLDAQVKLNADALVNVGAGVVVANVTALTVIDSVLVDTVKMVRWMVHVSEGNKIRSYEVGMTHDGTAAADATDAEFTKYARLRMNGSIGGLRVKGRVQGSGVTQTMELTVQADNPVVVSTSRMTVI